MTTGNNTKPPEKKGNSCGSSPLIDQYSRQIDYLRISLTQKCNHSCFFCHHEGEIGAGNEMTAEEIENLVRIANSRGVRRIKLTGGEALVRDDIVEIVRRLAPLTDDLSLTTNGSRLAELAPALRVAGLDRVNISLHTLKPELHEFITGRNNLPEVKAGIEKALAVGFQPVKINMAILQGINYDEIRDMMAYAGKIGAILQLIELQVIPEDDSMKNYWADLTEVEDELSRTALAVSQRSLHGRKQYSVLVNDRPVLVEVVRPSHNHSFCQRCTRLRVTSDGKLKPCLMKQDNLVEVHSLLGSETADELVNEALDRAVRFREPYWKGESE
ncbi:MAG: GTP 3',8-cyclase MoaA [Candidatus Thorarchaeota archaeon]